MGWDTSTGALSIQCFGCVSIEEGGSHFYLKRTGSPELEAMGIPGS